MCVPPTQREGPHGLSMQNGLSLVAWSYAPSFVHDLFFLLFAIRIQSSKSASSERGARGTGISPPACFRPFCVLRRCPLVSFMFPQMTHSSRLATLLHVQPSRANTLATYHSVFILARAQMLVDHLFVFEFLSTSPTSVCWHLAHLNVALRQRQAHPLGETAMCLHHCDHLVALVPYVEHSVLV
eukprot:4641892-Amphidinium_carterae.1